MATESPLKSELPAMEGRTAPAASVDPGWLACVSVSPVNALIRLRFCAPFPASCWIADWITCGLILSLACLRSCSAAREASIRSKLTAWSWLVAFSSASWDAEAKAANCVRIT